MQKIFEVANLVLAAMVAVLFLIGAGICLCHIPESPYIGAFIASMVGVLASGGAFLWLLLEAQPKDTTPAEVCLLVQDVGAAYAELTSCTECGYYSCPRYLGPRPPKRCDTCRSSFCIKEPLALLAWDEDCHEHQAAF